VRIVLVEADLLNGVGDARPRQSEVLETVGEVAVHRRINDGITNVGGELCMCVNWSGGGMEVEHASLLEDVRGVLLLQQEKSGSRRCHLVLRKKCKSPRSFAFVIGLNVNFGKSFIVPINVEEEKNKGLGRYSWLQN
jgi:hypothetical protein